MKIHRSGKLTKHLLKEKVRPEYFYWVNFNRWTIQAQYFETPLNKRVPFNYGICMFLCWGSMIVYGVGTALYIFSGNNLDFDK